VGIKGENRSPWRRGHRRCADIPRVITSLHQTLVIATAGKSDTTAVTNQAGYCPLGCDGVTPARNLSTSLRNTLAFIFKAECTKRRWWQQLASRRWRISTRLHDLKAEGSSLHTHRAQKPVSDKYHEACKLVSQN
jgi:hypothetical protein